MYGVLLSRIKKLLHFAHFVNVLESIYDKVLTMYASAMSEILPWGKSILHSARNSPPNLALPLVYTSQVLRYQF